MRLMLLALLPLIGAGCVQVIKDPTDSTKELAVCYSEPLGQEFCRVNSNKDSQVVVSSSGVLSGISSALTPLVSVLAGGL